MKRYNCPNCGAPIESTQCPYCGTVFYDFTVIDSTEPTYIRMNYNGKQIVFKGLMKEAEIRMNNPVFFVDNEPFYVYEPSMSASIEFDILPDDAGVLMKQIELEDKQNAEIL